MLLKNGRDHKHLSTGSYPGLRNTGIILPPPAMMVYKETFPEGEVAVIEVQPSEDTPVRYKGVIWIRIGARKAEANTEEERILTEKNGTDKTPGIIVNTTECDTDNGLGTNSDTNIRVNGTNNNEAGIKEVLGIRPVNP